MGGYIKDNPTTFAITTTCDNIVYHAYPTGTTAWITYDETQTVAGKSKVLRNTRTLEKEKGKIVPMLSYVKKNSKRAMR